MISKKRTAFRDEQEISGNRIYAAKEEGISHFEEDPTIKTHMVADRLRMS